MPGIAEIVTEWVFVMTNKVIGFLLLVFMFPVFISAFDWLKLEWLANNGLETEARLISQRTQNYSCGPPRHLRLCTHYYVTYQYTVESTPYEGEADNKWAYNISFDESTVSITYDPSNPDRHRFTHDIAQRNWTPIDMIYGIVAPFLIGLYIVFRVVRSRHQRAKSTGV